MTTSTSSSVTTLTSTATLTSTTSNTATTSTTRTSSTTTEASGPPPPAEEEVNNLLAAVDEAKGEAFEKLLAGGGSNVTVQLPGGGVMFASTLDSLGSSINQGGMEISMPKSFSSGMEGLTPPVEGDELVFSALTIDAVKASKLGGEAAVVLDLQWLAAAQKVKVSGLQEPVVFSLPVIYNSSKKQKCSYWNEETAMWTSEGVQLSDQSIDGGPMYCETVHFSLFGAVLDGIVATLVCANIDIFNLEAIQQLYRSQWYLSLGGIFLAAILGPVLLAFIAAAVLDSHRDRTYHWNDEYFLVPAPDDPVGDTRQSGEVIVQRDTPSPTATPATAQEHIANSPALLVGLIAAIYSCEAFTEALDDICSEWFAYFHELRALIENLCNGFSHEMVSCKVGMFAAMSHTMITQLFLHTSQHSAAASLGMSGNLVTFVLEDKDFKRYMINEIQRQREEEALSRTVRPSLRHNWGALSRSAGSWRRTQNQFEAWMHMRDEVCEAMLKHIHEEHGSWKYITHTCRTLLFRNPIGEVFVIDVFQSCKQKVAVLASEFLGAIVFVAIFFQGNGMVRGKAAKSIDQCAGDNITIGFRIGRFLVIATASLLIAGLPVTILCSLQTRGFKTIEGGRQGQAWKKQLRSWRIQAALFWVVAVTYDTLCVVYIALFLANMAPDDHWDFSFAGITTFLEDFVVVPFFWACLMPLITKVWLCCHSQVNGVSRGDMVRRVSEMLHCQSNMMLPIEQV